MTRALIFIAAVAIVVAFCAPASAAQSKPVVGHFEAVTVLFFTGKSTIFLESGAQLFGTDTGSIDLPPGLGGFASLVTFDGGTGAMSAATGQIRLRGDFSASEGTTTGDYLGTLCTQ